MEKYFQFRDKGSGIAPFFPVPREDLAAYLFPLYLIIFLFRLPLIITASLVYFGFLQWLPSTWIRKAGLWSILGIPGIWWIDLQIDGVKRGSLAQHHGCLPGPGSVIASSFTSPLDCLYIAAIFDPIFTASFPDTKLVQPISLFQAIFRALSFPQASPPPGAKLRTIASILKKNPHNSVVVLPECTTSNGRGILTLSPSVLSAPSRSKVYPVNLRYSPADVTTPLPGAYLSFLWDLLASPKHTIRVRIAKSVTLGLEGGVTAKESTDSSGQGKKAQNLNGMTPKEDDGQNMLDHIAEELARLGRSKRVGLGVHDKVQFVRAWSKNRWTW